MTVAVLTVSDSHSAASVPTFPDPPSPKFKRQGFAVVASEIVADEQAAIQQSIIRLAGRTALVVTTGGTGLAERDVTPEATAGFATAWWKAFPNGCASRAQKKLLLRRLVGESAGCAEKP